jgi:peptidylprolyl isomerase
MDTIMKLIPTLLLVPALALAQTAPKTASSGAAAKPHLTAHAATAASGCVKEPDLASPKVPALPASAPCAKHLYTITSSPTVKLEGISTMEGSDLATRLGIVSSSISLDYIDYKVGTGELAAPHKYYSVNYTGFLTDGTIFDSSALQGAPHTFLYGHHDVIPGWDTGLDGMRVGGKRRLIIPWQLAYGAQGRPPKIPARADLIFDLELVGQSDIAPPPPAKPVSPPVRPATAPAATPAPSGTPAPAAAPAAPPAATAPATPPAATPPTPATPPR